jgi:hypothetical protein
MSDRERWVVYPLLFLAIGMATMNTAEIQAERQMKKIETKTPEFDSIRCKELLVVGENDKPRVTLREATKQDVGLIMVYNSEGKPVTQLKADNTTGAGLVETASGNGTPQVVLSSNSHGGAVTLFDRVGKNVVQLAPPLPQAGNSSADESETPKENSPNEQPSKAPATETPPTENK